MIVRQSRRYYQRDQQKKRIHLDSAWQGENNTRFSGFARRLSITLRSGTPKGWSMIVRHTGNHRTSGAIGCQAASPTYGWFATLAADRFFVHLASNTPAA